MNDNQIENSVLGFLLTTPIAFRNKKYPLLTPEHFEDSKNAKIFEAIKEIDASNKAVDLLILIKYLRENKNLDYCGGMIYISKLTNSMIYEQMFESYILMLSEQLLRRKSMEVSNVIKNLAIDPQNDIFDVVSSVNKLVDSLNSTITVEESRTKEQIIKDSVEEIELRKTSGLLGLSSGIYEVDDRMKGWGKKELHIIAGRPAMGKTTFALSMFNAMTQKKGYSGAFFSLEMSDTSLMNKMFAINGGVESWRITTGKLETEHWHKINESIGRLLNNQVHIFDNYFKLDAIVRKIKQMVYSKDPKENIDFVIIDYLQLISNDGKGSREQEVSNISRTLKNLASELDIPIIALSQLSRKVEERGGDKKPMLSDLRESGSLEQDASTVTFCYRPDYYGFQGEDGQSLADKAYLIVAKNRNSELRDIELFYNKDINQEWMSPMMEINNRQPTMDAPINNMQPNDEF